jgi:hypothetical protein
MRMFVVNMTNLHLRVPRPHVENANQSLQKIIWYALVD